MLIVPVKSCHETTKLPFFLCISISDGPFTVLRVIHRQTAKFVAEAGISLALDSSSLPDMYGVLTPSTAMGTVLLEKLRAKGVDFYIGEHRA